MSEPTGTTIDLVYDRRAEKIRQIIRDNKADGFILFNHESSGQPGTRYLSGFSGSESVLVLTPLEKILFTDGRYDVRAREESKDFKIMPLSRASFFDQLEELCGKDNGSKFIFDSTRTYSSSLSKLSTKIKKISMIGVENILQTVRVVKDEEELAFIQEAASIANKAFIKLLSHIKEGVTEKELAWQLEVLMRENGAEKNSFDLIVVSGLNTAKPHGEPSDKSIKKGEFVTIDFGCFVKGYASDTTRTVALGGVSKELSDIYETVQKAQEFGCRAAKSGVTGAYLDGICRNYISQRGYGKYFVHSTGHGLGMEVHELPLLSPGEGEVLPENSVVTVEPGIYIEGVGGVRIEDSLILKSNHAINLNDQLSKELIVL